MVPSLSMSIDARTVPAPALPAAGRPAGSPGRLSRAWRRELADSDTGVLVGALALASIVTLSLLIVLVAANRPSLLTPTTHSGYFPRWMAGPLGGLLSGFTNDGTTLKNLFTGAMVVMYVSYVVLLKHAPRLPARWVVGSILAVHAIFLLSPPLALTDLFNYINYGRMEVVHDLNPYTTIPILEPHSDPSFILSNWHQLLSPYGPLFTLLTFVVVPLGVAGSFWALKSVLVLSSLATVWLVWKCARLLGRDPVAAVALIGLNPLVLVWGLGGDHNDFLMVLCIMLGFYMLLLARARARERAGGSPRSASPLQLPAEQPPVPAGRRALLLALPLPLLDIGAGAALVAAVAIKASAAVLIPIVLVTLLRAPRALVRVLVGMALAGVVVGAASLAAFGLHFPDLSTQSSLVTGESLPNLVGLALGLGGESAGVRDAMNAALVIAVLACCRLAWRRRDPVAPAGWASVALLASLGWILPWYVLWVLPFAALSSSRRLRTVALVFGAYLILTWAPSSGALWHAIGFHPERTPLGRLHQRYVRELLH
jgi:hypothetical protein